MEVLIVFLVLFTLLLIKVPIFLSLMAATLVGSLLNNKIHLIEIVRSSITGIDSLVLFAAPLFVLSGKLILHGGISERLILCTYTQAKTYHCTKSGSLRGSLRE